MAYHGIATTAHAIATITQDNARTSARQCQDDPYGKAMGSHCNDMIHHGDSMMTHDNSMPCHGGSWQGHGVPRRSTEDDEGSWTSVSAMLSHDNSIMRPRDATVRRSNALPYSKKCGTSFMNKHPCIQSCRCPGACRVKHHGISPYY